MAEPDVLSENNPAERSLRHLVISRKVSGGTRSEQGTESKMTLASSRRLPSVARFPSTLNCYVHEHPHNLCRRAVALRHIQRGQA